MSKSDGLRNVSKNVYGLEFDDAERKAVDWVAPTNFGLDNSVALTDAYKEIDKSQLTQGITEQQGRIFTSFKDIKDLKKEELQERMRKQAQGISYEENEENELDEYGLEKDAYKLGDTSGETLATPWHNFHRQLNTTASEQFPRNARPQAQSLWTD